VDDISYPINSSAPVTAHFAPVVVLLQHLVLHWYKAYSFYGIDTSYLFHPQVLNKRIVEKIA
jgi:hypothetical protein